MPVGLDAHRVQRTGNWHASVTLLISVTKVFNRSSVVEEVLMLVHSLSPSQRASPGGVHGDRSMWSSFLHNGQTS